MRLVYFHGRRFRPQLRPDGEPTKAFEPSLFVWATVMSRPAEDRAIVDAGLKTPSGVPCPCEKSGLCKNKRLSSRATLVRLAAFARGSAKGRSDRSDQSGWTRFGPTGHIL